MSTIQNLVVWIDTQIKCINSIESDMQALHRVREMMGHRIRVSIEAGGGTDHHAVFASFAIPYDSPESERWNTLIKLALEICENEKARAEEKLSKYKLQLKGLL